MVATDADTAVKAIEQAQIKKGYKLYPWKGYRNIPWPNANNRATGPTVK